MDLWQSFECQQIVKVGGGLGLARTAVHSELILYTNKGYLRCRMIRALFECIKFLAENGILALKSCILILQRGVCNCQLSLTC